MIRGSRPSRWGAGTAFSRAGASRPDPSGANTALVGGPSHVPACMDPRGFSTNPARRGHRHRPVGGLPLGALWRAKRSAADFLGRRHAMGRQSTGRRLLRFAAIGLAAACGRSDLLQDDANSAAAQQDAALVGASDSAQPNSGPDNPNGNPVPPGTVAPPNNPTIPEDAGCSASIATYDPTPSFASCWACVANGCAAELAACAADCACNSLIAGGLACINAGDGSPASCLAPALSAGNDSALSAVATCLVMVNVNCPCSGAVDAAPASTSDDGSAACVTMGGSAGGGNGSCTSTLGETCGGTNYQVVCACPQGSCACFGPSSHVISFAGCPYCPSPGGGPGNVSSDELFTRCGFPH